MQKVDPNNNNPANPLFKVAALELSKEYAGKGESRYIKVNVSLNFKKSNNLKGRTKTWDGRDVNVTFELSFTRAALEIICADDRGNSPSGFVKIEKVAYVAPLVIEENIKDNLSKNSKSEKSISGKIGGKIKSSFENLTSSASAEAAASAKSSDLSDKKRQIARKFASLNVSATHAGHKIHWEIKTMNDASISSAKEFLEGGVFVKGSNGSLTNACIVKRKDGGPIANVVLTASLMVSTHDMVVGPIRFNDDDGYKIEWTDVKGDRKSNNMISDIMSPTDARERMIRQVIRKHLVDQGMATHGDLIEVSRAST